MTALEMAVAAAHRGIGWEYPCLIWVADYLLDETGLDFAAQWRSIDWDEARGKRQLAALALQGQGECAVERAIDAVARWRGWEAADGPRQGAVMIGVFRDLAPNGSPAIFDGRNRWICAAMGGGLISTGRMPDQAWEVRHEAA